MQSGDVNYQEELKDFVTRHPEMNGRVTVIDPHDGRTGREIVSDLWDKVVPETAYDGTASDNAFLDAQKQRLISSIDNGLGANHAIMSSKTVPATPENYGFEEKIHQHIVVTSGESLKGELTGAQIADSAEDLHKGKLWYLHHELGHSLTVETLKGGETVQEAMADSYATIRHIERFGAESSFPQAMADARVVEAIHKGQADHLTSPAILETVRMHQAGEFEGLSGGDLKEKLMTSAQNNAVSPEDVKLFKEAFSPLNEAFNNGQKLSPDDIAKKVAEIGAGSDSAKVRGWAGDYLDAAERTFPPDALNRSLLNESRETLKQSASSPHMAETKVTPAADGAAPTSTKPVSKFGKFVSKFGKLAGVFGVAAVGYEVSQLERNAVRGMENGELSGQAAGEYQAVLGAHVAQATVDPTLVGGELVVQSGFGAWAKRHGVEGDLRENLRPSALTDYLKSDGEEKTGMSTRAAVRQRQKQRREDNNTKFTQPVTATQQSVQQEKSTPQTRGAQKRRQNRTRTQP